MAQDNRASYYWLFDSGKVDSDRWSRVVSYLGKEYPEVLCLSLEKDRRKLKAEHALFVDFHKILQAEDV